MNHFVSRNDTPLHPGAPDDKKQGAVGEKFSKGLFFSCTAFLLITALPALAQQTSEPTGHKQPPAATAVEPAPTQVPTEPKGPDALPEKTTAMPADRPPPGNIPADTECAVQVKSLENLLESAQKSLAECESNRAPCLPPSVDLRKRIDQALAEQQRLKKDQQRLMIENQQLKDQLARETPQTGAEPPSPGPQQATPPMAGGDGAAKSSSELSESSGASDSVPPREEKPKPPTIDPVVEAGKIIGQYPCSVLHVQKGPEDGVIIGGVIRSEKEQKRIASALEKKGVPVDKGTFAARRIDTDLCLRALPKIPKHQGQWVMAFDKRDDMYAESIDDLTVAYQDIPASARRLLPGDEQACGCAGVALRDGAAKEILKPLSASNAEIWAARGSNVILCRKDSWLSHHGQPCRDQQQGKDQTNNGWTLRSADVTRKDAILVIDISRTD
uniref:Uncharacterized protein n=1 Tax=Candidatus Kentrum sp. FM TaxID=2126340 RepID=A0A450RZ83_9GAMM|nr:MAG: hypothetical protein BECKFM1743C_GA0114222_100141 [Candidatus Kentron sp. FM]VFJ53471.1 MAG: hypothetical protein BECKFM1743A_GA0114220_101151 [Candidatus Kentron sp. FM]VFK20779.1 MAG: hypothetical protein BECKFM1743B_GA0114221_107271 [Candidatus Kentron sp. FM]